MSSREKSGFSSHIMLISLVHLCQSVFYSYHYKSLYFCVPVVLVTFYILHYISLLDVYSKLFHQYYNHSQREIELIIRPHYYF